MMAIEAWTLKDGKAAHLFWQQSRYCRPDKRTLLALMAAPELIYSMDANGDNLLQLTDHPAFDRQPAASPDGRRIAFTSERGGTPDLYVMDSDGNNVIRLAHEGFSKFAPAWSPDGTRIAFTSLRDVVGNFEIYAMDADGNNLTRLDKHARYSTELVSGWKQDSVCLLP